MSICLPTTNKKWICIIYSPKTIFNDPYFSLKLPLTIISLCRMTKLKKVLLNIIILVLNIVFKMWCYRRLVPPRRSNNSRNNTAPSTAIKKLLKLNVSGWMIPMLLGIHEPVKAPKMIQANQIIAYSLQLPDIF